MLDLICHFSKHYLNLIYIVSKSFLNQCMDNFRRELHSLAGAGAKTGLAVIVKERTQQN
jgi:hypothetical protein